MSAFFYPIDNKVGVPERLAGLRKISNALPYFGNRRAELISSKNHHLQLRQVTGKSQKLITKVLKILAIVSLIFLLLLACRVVYRLSNRITVEDKKGKPLSTPPKPVIPHPINPDPVVPIPPPIPPHWRKRKLPRIFVEGDFPAPKTEVA